MLNSSTSAATSTSALSELLKNSFKLSKLVFRNALVSWRGIVLTLAPIVLLPLPLIYSSKAARCLYVVAIMATYWVTEAMPIGVTALIPLFAYPLLAVLTVNDVCKSYFPESTWLFLGSIVIALAIEDVNLHKRFALRILLIIGTKPRRLLCGFMASTAFLSMWISNTACAAMMLPICAAVLDELRKPTVAETAQKENEDLNPRGIAIADVVADDIGDANSRKTVIPENVEAMTPFQTQLSKCMLLSIAYSSSIGGTTTLVGTGSNIVFKDFTQRTYPLLGTIINFGAWIGLCLPLAFILLAATWCWLQMFFLGWRQLICCECLSPDGDNDIETAAKGVKAMLRQRYSELGSCSYAEKLVIILFLSLVAAWASQEVGWGPLLDKGKDKYAANSIPAILVCVLLFVLPREMPDLFCRHRNGNELKARPSEPLLPFSAMQRKFPWGLVFLVGGGFAMANGVKASKLSDIVAVCMEDLSVVPRPAIMLICFTTVVFLTEVSSNAAVVTLFLPIMDALSRGLQINPLYLTIPVTLGASYAFMLPVASPPNAIIFASGQLKIREMVVAGFGMNIICLLITFGYMHTLPYHWLELGEFPSWAVATNAQQNTTYVANIVRCSLS